MYKSQYLNIQNFDLISNSCLPAGKVKLKIKNSSGFTLIELLVVIGILGIIATFISGNFFVSLKRGRDTRRKSDIQQIQNAFELYYEDNGQFPPSDALTGTTLCHPTDGCDGKIYMQRIPTDPSSKEPYTYETDGNQTYYKLYSCLENTQDEAAGVEQNGWGNSCGACGVCKFKVESANAD